MSNNVVCPARRMADWAVVLYTHISIPLQTREEQSWSTDNCRVGVWQKAFIQYEEVLVSLNGISFVY